MIFKVPYIQSDRISPHLFTYRVSFISHLAQIPKVFYALIAVTFDLSNNSQKLQNIAIKITRL